MFGSQVLACVLVELWWAVPPGVTIGRVQRFFCVGTALFAKCFWAFFAELQLTDDIGYLQVPTSEWALFIQDSSHVLEERSVCVCVCIYCVGVSKIVSSSMSLWH